MKRPAMTAAERQRRYRDSKKAGYKVTSKVVTSNVLAEGISPLEVMLRAMRHAWKEGDMVTAVRHANLAAPYVHPKLASTEVTGANKGPVQFENVTDEDRIAAFTAFARRTGLILPPAKETEH